MKKIIYVYILLGMVILAGCGSKNSDSSGSDSSLFETAEEKREEAKEKFADVLADETKRIEDEAEPSTTRVKEEGGNVSIPSNGKPTLLDFSATWCGPCKMMKPVFDELADTYDDKINFVTVDVDANPGLASQYAIQAVPTFVFLDSNGKSVRRIEGAVEQSVLENQIGIMISKR